MQHDSKPDFRFAGNVLIKGLLLFLIVNFGLASFDPLPGLGRWSAYNAVIPGRARLPYGDRPDRAYNLSLYQLEAMFASHEIAGAAGPGEYARRAEYRVVVIGDSSVWGFRLKFDQTLTAYINAAEATTTDGRLVRAYNLGYPIMSLAKDLLILDQAMRYDPDLIVWMVTLESFPYDKQLFPPLLQNNPEPVRGLIRDYDLRLALDDPNFVNPSFWDRTLVGRRRALADVLRLQLYGVLWAATGVDQDIPEQFTPRMEDLPADESFHNLHPPALAEGNLAFDILRAGMTRAGDVPVVIVNEPMFVSQGANSDVRYNFFYPRWAYDQYRVLLAEESRRNGWRYLDWWDGIPSTEFTDSAVHLTPSGSVQLAVQVTAAILEFADTGNINQPGN